ncbi:hypothetical protein AB0N81_02915 [Streptomyces sp. NPDC093510]|uniref:hypothetical protein n=1 Tax=Streptomyces sp. NPDC093510 TaxID=3155199 RepID=UPI003445D32E
MSTPNRPRLKSIPSATTGPHPAKQAEPRPAVGASRGVAEGVPTALRPDPHAATPPRPDGRFPIAWLHICAPRGATPTATSTCECGRNRSAVGHGKVLALITDHAAHRPVCPLRAPQEGRAAA